MIALFHVPAGSETAMAGYVAVVFALYMAVFASFSVPYLAVAGDLRLSAHQRTVLMAWRLGFTALGVLVAGALAPAYAARAGGGQPGYEAMALLLAGLCAVSLVIGWWGAGQAGKAVGVSIAAQDKLTLADALHALADRRFSVLALVNLLQLVAAGLAYAGLLYFITYNLGIADGLTKIGPVVLIASLGIIVAQPFWVRIAARIGKQRAYVYAALIHALAHLGWAAAPLWFRAGARHRQLGLGDARLLDGRRHRGRGQGRALFGGVHRARQDRFRPWRRLDHRPDPLGLRLRLGGRRAGRAATRERADRHPDRFRARPGGLQHRRRRRLRALGQSLEPCHIWLNHSVTVRGEEG
jgi:hypothetical protein